MLCPLSNVCTLEDLVGQNRLSPRGSVDSVNVRGRTTNNYLTFDMGWPSNPGIPQGTTSGVIGHAQLQCTIKSSGQSAGKSKGTISSNSKTWIIGYIDFNP